MTKQRRRFDGLEKVTGPVKKNGVISGIYVRFQGGVMNFIGCIIRYALMTHDPFIGPLVFKVMMVAVTSSLAVEHHIYTYMQTYFLKI